MDLKATFPGRSAETARPTGLKFSRSRQRLFCTAIQVAVTTVCCRPDGKSILECGAAAPFHWISPRTTVTDLRSSTSLSRPLRPTGWTDLRWEPSVYFYSMGSCDLSPFLQHSRRSCTSVVQFLLARSMPVCVTAMIVDFSGNGIAQQSAWRWRGRPIEIPEHLQTVEGTT